MSKRNPIYCGIDKPRKGQTRGTYTQCKKQGQLRYYGVEQIPKAELDKITRNKREAAAISKLRTLAKKKDNRMELLTNSFVALQGMIENENNPVERKKLETQATKLNKQIQRLLKEIERNNKSIEKKLELIKQ